MKKIILGALFTIISVTSNAQNKEGHIHYTIEMSSDDPQMEMVISMMQGSELDVYFSDKKSRTVMNMGTMMTNSTVVDTESGEMLMLMSGMTGNMAVSDNIENAKDEAEEPDVEIEFIDETKEIAGYECKKAILTSEDSEMEIWYTEEFEMDRTGQGVEAEGIPGAMLEYSTNNQGMEMHFIADSVQEKLTKEEIELFSFDIPDGYKVMTMEELKAMGMGQ